LCDQCGKVTNIKEAGCDFAVFERPTVTMSVLIECATRP